MAVDLTKLERLYNNAPSATYQSESTNVQNGIDMDKLTRLYNNAPSPAMTTRGQINSVPVVASGSATPTTVNAIQQQNYDRMQGLFAKAEQQKDLTAADKIKMSAGAIGRNVVASPIAAASAFWQTTTDPVELEIQALERKADQGILDEAGWQRLAELKPQQYTKELDTSGWSWQQLQKAQQLQEDVSAGFGNTGKFLYNTGMSMATNLATLPANLIAPGASLALMGTQSMAGKALDVAENGGSAGEALYRGLVSGGIETATEAVSLDTLSKAFKGKIGKTLVGKAITNLAKEGKLPPALMAAIEQSFSEGGEELVSAIANYAADAAAGDPNAQLTAEDLVLSFLGGALSGGVMGAGGYGVGRVVDNIKNKQADKTNSAEITNNSTENAVLQSNAKDEEKETLIKKVQEMAGVDTRTETEKVMEEQQGKIAAMEDLVSRKIAPQEHLDRVRQSAEETIAETKAKQENIDYQKQDVESGAVRQQMLNEGREKAVDRIEKFAAKRNLKVKYFDADINVDGYGFIEGDTMYLNARSGDKALQKAAIHETIHGLRSNNQEEFDNLFNTIIDYAEQYKGLHDVVNKTLATYSNPKSLAYKGILADDGSGEIDQNKLGEEVLAKLCEEVIDDPAAFIEKVDGDKTLLSSVAEFLRKIKNNLAITLTNSEKAKLDNAVMAIENYIRGEAENNSTKYSVEYDKNGKPFVVIDTDILANVSKKDWVSTVKQALQNRTINMGIFEIAVDSKIRNEYFNSEYSKKIKAHKKDLYKAKLRMANNLDEIVQNAYSVKNEDPKHYPHKFFESFNRSTIDVVFGTQSYEIKVVTGINTLNNEIVYDIVDIKKKTVPRSTPIQSTLKKGTVSINSVTQHLKNNNGNKLSAEVDENVVDDIENLSIREKIEAVTKGKGADSRSFNEQRKAENLFIKQLSGIFGIPTATNVTNERILAAKSELKNFVKDITKEIKSTGMISEETLDGLIDKAFEYGVMDIGGRDVSLEDYYGEYSDAVKSEMRKTIVDYIEVFEDRINEIANYEAALLDREQKRKEMLEKGPISLEEFYAAHQKTYLAEKKLRAVENNALLTEAEKKLVNALMAGVDKKTITGPRKNKIIAVYEAKKAVNEARAPITQYRAALRNNRESVADRALVTFRGWNDKGGQGLRYDTETFERNVRDIVPDKSEAQFIIDTYVKPVHKAEAAATRMKNDLRQKIKDLGIDTGNKKLYKIVYGMEYKDSAEIEVNESGLVQLLGEGLIDEARIKSVGADFEKIKNATNVFKEIYADLYKQTNEALLRNGYAPMGKIENYFPHFIEEADTMLSKIAKRAGFEITTNKLPTDIAGITDTFRPGKKFFGHTLSRNTDTTVYDAIKGFDQYIEGAAAVIHQTDNIQNIRTLENRLRFNAGDAGLKKALLEIDMDNTKTETEKQDAKDKLYEETKNSNLSGFVSYLRRYGDNLAGKKHRGDRGIEDDIGRGVYTLSKALESRIASNMIGGNIGSALTNIIPITQATAEIKTKYLLKAMNETMDAMREKDSSFEIDSDFLVNRIGSEKIFLTNAQKASQIAGAAMQAVDRFTSNVIVRAKYQQNVEEYQMTPEDAMDDANSYAAELLADRSKGALPLFFERKNPIVKAVTMFQVEQNNQLRYLIKDLPKNLKEEGKNALIFALLKYAVAAWLYNLMYKKIAGRKPAFDPIDIGYGITKDTISTVKGEMKTSAALTNAATAVAEEIPFISGLVGGGRVPISSALPDAAETIKLADRDVSAEKKKSIVKKELTKPLWYLALPTGGGQLKKIADTAELYGKNKGVQYSIQSDGSRKVQFANDPSVGTVAQSAVFGKWASKPAQEYINSGFKGLTKGQTENFELYKSWGMSNKVAFAKAKESKAMTDKQVADMQALAKAGMSESDAYMLVTTYKEKADTDKNNSLKTKEAVAYIEKLDLTMAQKAILFSCMCPTVKNNPYK